MFPNHFIFTFCLFFQLDYKFYHDKFQTLYSVTIKPFLSVSLSSIFQGLGCSLVGQLLHFQDIEFISTCSCVHFTIRSFCLVCCVCFVFPDFSCVREYQSITFILKNILDIYLSHTCVDTVRDTLLFHAAVKTFGSNIHRLFALLCLDVPRTFFRYGVQQYHPVYALNLILKKKSSSVSLEIPYNNGKVSFFSMAEKIPLFHFFYTFIHWQRLRLFPYPNYCKQCCDKQGAAYIFLSQRLCFLQINTLKWNSRITWQFYF